jgi:hypothetical protein
MSLLDSNVLTYNELLLFSLLYSILLFLFQGKERYLELISRELETHGTVYQPPGHSAQLPSNIINHGLLTQDQFLQLLRRAKVTTKLEPMPQCLRTHEDNYYLDLLCKLPVDIYAWFQTWI